MNTMNSIPNNTPNSPIPTQPKTVQREVVSSGAQKYNDLISDFITVAECITTPYQKREEREREQEALTESPKQTD